MPDTKFMALLNTGRFAVNRVWKSSHQIDITTKTRGPSPVSTRRESFELGEIITETMRHPLCLPTDQLVEEQNPG
jgi:hypothetical protein